MNKIKHSPQLLNACILMAIALLYFARMPGAFLHPIFYCEDGVLFFAQAYFLGVHSVTYAYAGYIHLIPRLLALISVQFPLATVQHLFTYSAIVVQLATAAYIIYARLEYRLRVCMALSIILVPVAGEAFGSVTNVQWITACLFYVILIQQPPQNTKRALVDYVILFVLSLTGPFVLFSLGLYLYKHWRQRSTYTYYCLLPQIIGACNQLRCILNSERFHATYHNNWHISAIIKLLAFRWVNPVMLLFRANTPFTTTTSALIIILFVIPMITCLVIAHQRKAALFPLYSALLLISALFLSSIPCHAMHFFMTLKYECRYFYLPTLYLAWFYLQAYPISKTTRVIATSMLALMLLGTLHHFEFSILKFNDQHWYQSVAALKAHQPALIAAYPDNWRFTLMPNPP